MRIAAVLSLLFTMSFFSYGQGRQYGVRKKGAGQVERGARGIGERTKAWCVEAGFDHIDRCMKWARETEVLFVERFNDADFSSRGWYGVREGTPVLRRDNPAPGSERVLECRLNVGAKNCGDGTPARATISETESIYFSYWVRYSTNWIGSGGPSHPHEFHFLTNKDDEFVGPARTHLTAYVEQNNLIPRISLQDARNVDENCILRGNGEVIGCDGDFESYPFTEARSVASCNGVLGYLDPVLPRNGRDCFINKTYWYSSRHWSGTKGPAFIPGKWHHVEVLLSLNDIIDGKGVANGAIRHWVDGESMITSDNILFRTGDHSDMAFNYFMFAPYIGVGSPIEQVMWIGEITIANGVKSYL